MIEKVSGEDGQKLQKTGNSMSLYMPKKIRDAFPGVERFDVYLVGDPMEKTARSINIYPHESEKSK